MPTSQIPWIAYPKRQRVPPSAALGVTQPTGEALGQFLFFIGPLLDKTEIGLYAQGPPQGGVVGGHATSESCL